MKEERPSQTVSYDIAIDKEHALLAPRHVRDPLAHRVEEGLGHHNQIARESNENVNLCIVHFVPKRV